MGNRIAAIGTLIAALALSAGAQTNSFPASGNVGIGTTAPNQSLEVLLPQTGTIAGFGANGVQDLFTIGYIGNGQTLLTGSIYGPTVLQTQNNQSIALVPNGTGNVGIGTTSPSYLLTTGSTGAIGILNSPNNGAAVDAIVFANSIYPTSYNNSISSVISGNPSWSSLNFNVANGAGTRATVLTLLGSGNAGIGTSSPGARLEINGGVKLTANSGASITFQDGTVQSTAYTGVSCGGDYAESVDVTGERKKYEPGDVLVIDPEVPGRFLKSAEPYSTFVTGIYSTRPGMVGRRQMTPKSPEEVPMAMMGIVPTKVTAENGPIHPGDLLVTSATLGYAMKGTDHSRMLGAVIGKALGNLDLGSGVMEVVVTLQ
jgi:hypothetical protein